MRKYVARDLALIRGYQDGNQACLEQLIHLYKKKVFTYIHNVVDDRAQAEDLFQETFIRVIHSLRSGKYSEKGKFVHWVLRIAHNLIMDHIRVTKRAQQVEVVEEETEDDVFDSYLIDEFNAEERLIEEQTRQVFKDLIELLPPEQKEIVVMRHYRDLSFKQIAEERQISINTVLGRMRYALINLRKIVYQQEIVYADLC